ncbi:MAG: hypothetical protein ACTSPS_05595 [Promethearchaeota archaeon]|jgi:hypothetical protein
MVDPKKKMILGPEEKDVNSNLIINNKSNKVSQDSRNNQKNDFDLDFLDWIIDKGWLRTKK